MRKRRQFTKEDYDLINLMIKHGESDEMAVNKIYSHVYTVREAESV